VVGAPNTAPSVALPSMETALLIMVREGFEGALVVAIVFAYLRRLDRTDLAVPVWLGVATAVVVSLVVGLVVNQTIGSLEGVQRLRAFAAISLLAAGVLTWMIFWMRRQSRLIKGELEDKVDAALARTNAGFALAGVAFVAVLREGIEAALFLLAAATSSSGRDVLVGGLIGLAVAVALAYAVYLGGRRIPLALFFKITGVILIVFAAGLLSKVVLNLQASEDLSSFNLNGVYDLRSLTWLTTDTESGKFLGAMLGWDPRPSIEQVLVWLAYAVPVTVAFFWPSRRSGPPAPTPVPSTSTAAPV
jgi:high-affinity iron transporter